jgi:putative hemolysin
VNPTVGGLIVGACVLVQGFFSGSEMALVSCNRARLEASAAQGSAGAVLALQLLEQEDRLLGTCLIGTNLSLIAGTTVAGLVLAAQGYGEEWLLTLLYLPVGLLFGEALPKVLYRHYADTLAPRLAPALRIAQSALSPALWVVSRWSSVLRRVLGAQDSQVRREDIVQLLDEEGSIDPEDRDLIRRLLEMSEISVEEAMTPLIDVQTVPEEATVGQAITVVLSAGHSRLPVYRERVDNIVGMVDHRDLLFAESDDQPIGSLTKPIRFVPDSKRIDELLREMKDSGESFAAVVDEYGGSVGIVTMEDLFEQVIGEIEDERDLQGPAIRQLSEREWRVPARTPVEDLEAAIGRKVPPGDYETVAGLLLAVSGRIPVTGEVVRLGRLTLHVEAASERAVHLVRVVLLE